MALNGNESMANIRVIIVCALIGMAIVGYMAWLDHGCGGVGVMTWSGKVCYEDLPQRGGAFDNMGPWVDTSRHGE